MYIFKGLTAPPISASELAVTLAPLAPSCGAGTVLVNGMCVSNPGAPIQPGLSTPNHVNIFGMLIPKWLLVVGGLAALFIGYKVFVAKSNAKSA